MGRSLPFGWGERLLSKPSTLIRLLRVITEAAMMVVPKSVWYTKRIAQVWRNYHFRDRRGEKLAREHLAGTDLLPETISFPPATVLVGGWPGWLTVSEATERVEATLDRKIEGLAQAERPAEIERWLDRFLEFRQTGWRRGLFSTDAHLKNFGVIGDRIVLLDTGGLTNRWGDIDERLSKDVEIREPHVHLGLEHALEPWPEVARHFNERWKSTVNRDTVEDRWPDPPPR